MTRKKITRDEAIALWQMGAPVWTRSKPYIDNNDECWGCFSVVNAVHTTCDKLTLVSLKYTPERCYEDECSRVLEVSMGKTWKYFYIVSEDEG